jgi:hypothetical protein
LYCIAFWDWEIETPIYRRDNFPLNSVSFHPFLSTNIFSLNEEPGNRFGNLLWELTLGTCFGNSLWELASGTCFGNLLRELALGTRFGNSLFQISALFHKMDNFRQNANFFSRNHPLRNINKYKTLKDQLQIYISCNFGCRQRQETLDLPYLTLLCDNLKKRMFLQNFFS